MTMNTVWAHTSGLDTSVLRISCTRYSPYSGGAAGCSHSASGGMIHETCGRLPLATSATNDAGYCGASACSKSAASLGFDGAQKVEKYGNGLSSDSDVG